MTARDPVASAPPAAGAGHVPRKPMARVRRVRLVDREVRLRLSPSALDILLGDADVLSEGQREGGQGRGRFFGSTMITIDLLRHARAVCEPCDAATARELANLLAEDAHARARLRAVARQEAERLAGAALLHVSVELKFRTKGARVFVDADVEGTIR